MVKRAKTPKLCSNGDGKKAYAKGFCHACYMRDYRASANTPPDDPEDELREDAEPEVVGAEALDDVLRATGTRVPSTVLATGERPNDTEGVRKMRRKLASQLYLARREVVKTMLYDGYEPWQVKNEFLNRADLFRTFLLPLQDPDRTLEQDMESFRVAGRMKPLERYIDGLRRSLRRANAFAGDETLTSRERSSWAKSADDIQRNLGILEKAIHVVPGRGDLPVTNREFDDEEDDEEDDSNHPYRLPDVEEDEDASDH